MLASVLHSPSAVQIITPDIEEELAAVDRGETVMLEEFNTMFAQWLE